MDRVANDFQDVYIVVDGIGLMPWTEVKDFSHTPVEAAATSKYLTPLEPTDEDNFVWWWNVVILTIHLSAVNLEVVTDFFSDGVSGVNNPKSFLLTSISRLHVACGSHKTTEDLGGSTSRVENN